MKHHSIDTFIFSSSCAVYGNPLYTPLDENHPTHPISPYGKSKLYIESILEDCARAYDLSYICLRYFNAAGATPHELLGEQHEPETHLIARLIQAVLDDQPFYGYGTSFNTPDGSAIRDFIHVQDIAKAHLLAYTFLKNGGSSTAINLGTGKGFSVKEVIDAVETVCKKKLKTIWQESRPGDPAFLVADAQKAYATLAWSPSSSSALHHIISSAYEFELVRRSTLRQISQSSTKISLTC